MAKITDEIIVIDLEATCWDELPPPGEQSEIIEIGVSVLSRRNPSNTWEIVGGESMLIKPTKSVVSQFCTDLTSITQKDLDTKGMDFFYACRALENVYDSKHKPFASWGEYDRIALEKQCKNNVRYPFGPTHWNLKDLFSLRMKLDREVGLMEALKILNMDFIGDHHRGVDDAFNTARVMQHII